LVDSLLRAVVVSGEGLYDEPHFRIQTWAVGAVARHANGKRICTTVCPTIGQKEHFDKRLAACQVHLPAEKITTGSFVRCLLGQAHRTVDCFLPRRTVGAHIGDVQGLVASNSQKIDHRLSSDRVAA
jgi:hypothetical protein